MKRIKLLVTLLLVTAIMVLVSCAQNPTNPQESTEQLSIVEQYRNNLNILYEELENMVGENVTKEEWDIFSKDWMPRLTGSQPEGIDDEAQEADRARIDKLNNAKNQLMYLWTEYDKKINNNELDEEKVSALKRDIQESLK